MKIVWHVLETVTGERL